MIIINIEEEYKKDFFLIYMLQIESKKGQPQGDCPLSKIFNNLIKANKPVYKAPLFYLFAQEQ